MVWTPFFDGFRLEPHSAASPETLVIMLDDVGASTATLMPVAERWAPGVPTTAFIALHGQGPLTPPFYGLPPDAGRDITASMEPAALDRAARALRPLLEHQLQASRLDASRLVVVGRGYGGTLALHMALRQGLTCAGILTFDAKLPRSFHPPFRTTSKVRLIACIGDDHASGRLRDHVGLLNANGVDTRGVVLAGVFPSDESIRYGGAYLVELVATAQGGGEIPVE